MNDIIPRVGIPVFQEQLRRATEAIERCELVYGPHLEELEEELTSRFGKKYALLTANGFSAMFLALQALELPSQSILTTPVSTCFAMVNAIKAAGHEPSYQEIDSSSLSILNVEQSEGVVALIPDHFGIIAPACKSWMSGSGVLIEDAAQSFLSRSTLKTDADVTVVSFYPTKIINGIDGGALLTDNEELYQRAKQRIYYGTQLEYEAVSKFNLKMNNINAAFALGSLEHYSELVTVMRKNYDLFTGVLHENRLSFLERSEDEVPSMLIVFARDEAQCVEWRAQLQKAGISTGTELISTCPPNLRSEFPVAHSLLKTTLSLPINITLTDSDVSKIMTELGRL